MNKEVFRYSPGFDARLMLAFEGKPRTACGYLNLLQNNIIPEITALFPHGNEAEIPAP